MEKKKTILLSTIQLIAVTAGVLFTAAIDFPQGIFFLLPLCAAPLSEIYKLKNKQIKLERGDKL